MSIKLKIDGLVMELLCLMGVEWEKMVILNFGKDILVRNVILITVHFVLKNMDRYTLVLFNVLYTC